MQVEATSVNVANIHRETFSQKIDSTLKEIEKVKPSVQPSKLAKFTLLGLSPPILAP